MTRRMLAALAIVFVAGSFIEQIEAYGQAGLRESLERLDVNKNGEIDPEEVTPLSRPYLDRITSGRMYIGRRSVEIEDIQEAARRYYSQRNGAYERDIEPDPDDGIKSFGPSDDEPVIPAFGLAEVKYPYTQDDLDFAKRMMRRYDDDRDGYIDREEALEERWTHRDPFDDDMDKDGRISLLELTQRYARRRLLDQSSDELRRKAWRGGNEIRSYEDEREERGGDSWWRRGGSGYWLTASVLGRFDANKNGRLEANEAAEMGMPTSQIDVDLDGELSREELFAYLNELQDQSGALVEGIPGWFYELDTNRDKQVSMSEFATDWSDDKLREFNAYDINGDGLLTSGEVLRSKALVGGSYRNTIAEVLPPGRTVISEIDIDEDYEIGDLNVKLSITHTSASALDAYLTGPDGQRIELFTAVGGRDDNFDNTVFDDQSQYPITKARPPFKGTFMPEALSKRQPSLNHFNGKS
ncbi:MAG: calcium sensor EFh, partial [Planctomycetota bacterium]